MLFILSLPLVLETAKLKFNFSILKINKIKILILGVFFLKRRSQIYCEKQKAQLDNLFF